MIAAIIQARMGSTRLPGKVMMPLAEQPMIGHTLKRVQSAQAIDAVILATTTHSDDNPLADYAESLGVQVFRGDEQDVLDRYYQAAKHFSADVIVRITGDCPVIDAAVIDQTVRYFLADAVDYASNFVQRHFPDGLDTEVFSFDALEHAWNEAKLPSEREHVTPYIWKNPDKFRLSGYTHPEDLSHYRWTVDEPADFDFMTAVFAELYAENPFFNMRAMLDLLKRRPELMQINQGITTNEGYQKSLQSDAPFQPEMGWVRYIGLTLLYLFLVFVACVLISVVLSIWSLNGA
jgi:spore coat polysaccharide biosynthesis protein SpsF